MSDEPIEMVTKHDQQTVAYGCPSCGVLYTGSIFGGGLGGLEAARHSAMTHCLPKTCTCGKPIEQRSYTKCNACIKTGQEEREKKRFDAAQKLKIENYDGPVYWEDGPSSSMGDGYYLTVEDLLDACEEEELDLPPYVWATKPVLFQIKADNIIENALSDHHEDAYDSIPGKAFTELQATLDEWCGRQNITSWEPDYSRAIVLQGD